MNRFVLGFGFVSAVSSFVTIAHADDAATNRCVEAHHASQTDRRGGHLLRARNELVTCAQDACPALIASDCKRWLGEIGDRVPTVVVVTAAGENAPATTRLVLDGNPIDPSLVGRAIEVDPGRHDVHAEAGAFVGEASVVAVEGAHGTTVTVTLRDPDTSPPTTQPRRRSLVPFVVGGIGIAGLAVASGFGIAGLAERSHLENEGCAPNCNHDDVGAVRRNFAIADVALGISVVAIATAVVLYVVDSPSTPTQGRASFTFRF